MAQSTTFSLRGDGKANLAGARIPLKQKFSDARGA